MKRQPMLWLLAIPGIIAASLAAFLVFGLTQPVKHSVTRSITLHQTPEPVFAILANAEDLPSWSSLVTRVERLPDRDGRPVTRQTMGKRWSFIATELERKPPTLLIGQLEREGGPIMGTWTYRIEPQPEGSRVSITEDGVLENPFMRAMMRLQGLDSSIRRQLTDLARKFGERAEVQ